MSGCSAVGTLGGVVAGGFVLEFPLGTAPAMEVCVVRFGTDSICCWLEPVELVVPKSLAGDACDSGLKSEVRGVLELLSQEKNALQGIFWKVAARERKHNQGSLFPKPLVWLGEAAGEVVPGLYAPCQS